MEESWRQREAFQLYSHILVLFLPQKLVDAKKPGCESSITSESVMILPVSFAESKLCSRQSRHQTLDAWND